MTLRDDTTRTLTVLSFILLLLGLVVGSPAGKIFLFVVAALPAAVVAAFGASRRMRILAGVALVASVALAVATYPAYRSHMDAWRAHATGARRPPASPPAAPAGDAPPPSAPPAGR